MIPLLPHVHRHFVLGALALVCGCGSEATKPVSQSFSASGVTKVILRADGADSAVVTLDAPAETVELSGIPTGGAQGYHSPEPGWRETPPERWPFGFAAQRHGAVLVVSTKGEIHHIHHHYVLSDLRMRVPAGVAIVRQSRVLSGSGEPDLSEP